MWPTISESFECVRLAVYTSESFKQNKGSRATNSCSWLSTYLVINWTRPIPAHLFIMHLQLASCMSTVYAILIPWTFIIIMIYWPCEHTQFPPLSFSAFSSRAIWCHGRTHNCGHKLRASFSKIVINIQEERPWPRLLSCVHLLVHVLGVREDSNFFAKNNYLNNTALHTNRIVHGLLLPMIAEIFARCINGELAYKWIVCVALLMVFSWNYYSNGNG